MILVVASALQQSDRPENYFAWSYGLEAGCLFHTYLPSPLLLLLRRYEFNDSHVGPADPERSVSGTAYVLFYKRRSGSLKWGGIVPSSEPMPDE